MTAHDVASRFASLSSKDWFRDLIENLMRRSLDFRQFCDNIVLEQQRRRLVPSSGAAYYAINGWV